MKKLTLLLAMTIAIGTSAQSDSTETKQRTNGDLLIASGTTNVLAGLVTLIASRSIGKGLIASGAVTAGIGVVMNNTGENKKKKKKKN